MRLFLIICILFITSCGYHAGLMMSNAEFDEDSEIVSFAYGEAKTTHVFGIGGLNSKALVRDARFEMYSAFPLKKGQAYSNLSVDFNKRFFFFWVVTHATITADVVNLNGETTDNEMQKFFKNSALSLISDLDQEDPRFWTLYQDSVLYF